MLGAQQRLAGEAVHRPQVLVGGDVAEVPHERAHDGIQRAVQVVVVDVRDELQRALPRRLQRLGDRVDRSWRVVS